MKSALQPETKTFMRLYRQIAKISLDVFPAVSNPNPNLAAATLGDPNFFASESFESNYFQHIFVQRPAHTDYLIRKLKDPGEFPTICFIGPPRSGKTSISRRAWRVLQASENTFCIYLDVRQLVRENPDKPAMQLISQNLRANYRGSLFDPTVKISNSSYDAATALRAYLLYIASTGQATTSLFDLREDLLTAMAGKQDQEDFSSTDAICEWIVTSGYADQGYRTILNQLARHANLRHLALATRDIHRKNLQVIFVDNLDQLDRHQQLTFFEEIANFHGQAADLVRFCVAVRDENIRNCASERAVEKSTDPRTMRFRIDMPRRASGVVFPSCELASAQPGELTQITIRRIQAIKNLLIQRRLREQQKISVETDLKQKERRQTRLERLRAAEQDGHVQEIQNVSNKMLRAMNEDSIICLTNGSIQDFLIMHGDFLTRLLALGRDDSGKLRALTLSPWHVKTLVYRFLRESDRESSEFGLPNLFQEARAWRREKEAVGCTLKYLIASSTWSAERNEEKLDARYPTLQEMFDNLRALGFDEQTLTANIRRSFRNGIIEYRNPKVPADELNMDRQVLVSLRGKTLISYTVSPRPAPPRPLPPSEIGGGRRPQLLRRSCGSVAVPGSLRARRVASRR